jgi:hypothetical protein
MLVAALCLWAATAQAQTAREVQIQAVGVLRSDEYVGGGLGFALRSPGRTRVAVAASLGAAQQAVALRGDLLLSYHLLPFRRSGVTPYAGGGLSVLVVRSQADPYLMLVVGVEAAPLGRTGWFLEGGIAGGVRFAGGWRVRWGGRVR